MGTADENALSACRDAGFAENTCVYDVRAGACRITTLSVSVVILADENGQKFAIDGASELLASYRSGSIRLEDKS